VIGKPSLFLALAGTAALSVVAHAAAVAEAPQPTRMGVSIQQSVAERDKDAARRNRALDLREQTARAAEERLKSELQARPQADARAGKAEPQDDQFESLARIYQAMKPAKAAKVFEQLDLEVQMRVAQRMRDRSTAMILAAMTPEGAARLSMALARRGAPPPGARPAPRTAVGTASASAAASGR
jgi:flagellar motility protein MotE (MotC chaperone)